MANLLAELSAALANDGVETVPPDWKSAREIGDQCGYATSQTQRILSDAVRTGRLEMRKFRIRSGSRVYPVPHYRVIS
jgi:hypothetical protein